MKKLVFKSVLLFAMLLALTACGKKQDEKEKEAGKIGSQVSHEETGKVDYNAEDYIAKLGDYKGVEYVKQAIEPSELDIQKEVDQFLARFPNKVTDRAIKKGDTANIDFVGKKDGVAFEGGTAKNYALEIGGGRFIPGFEEGLIGKKPGETVDLDLKFPEDYHAEDLKGAAVVFTVTINHIEEPLAELTDELVAKETTFKTVADYRNNIKQELFEANRKNAVAAEQAELLTKVVSRTEFKGVPENLLKSFSDEYIKYYENLAKSNNVTLEDYAKNIMKISLDELNANAKKLATSMAEQRLVIDTIAKKESIEASDEDYQVELEEYYKASGYASQMDKAGFEKLVGKENVRNIVVAKKVLKFIVENGKPME